ncbi:hypothetical protein [Microseira sp. BLCC-F43]
MPRQQFMGAIASPPHANPVFGKCDRVKRSYPEGNRAKILP